MRPAACSFEFQCVSCCLLLSMTWSADMVHHDTCLLSIETVTSAAILLCDTCTERSRRQNADAHAANTRCSEALLKLTCELDSIGRHSATSVDVRCSCCCSMPLHSLLPLDSRPASVHFALVLWLYLQAVAQDNESALVAAELLSIELEKRQVALAAQRSRVAALAGQKEVLQESMAERRQHIQVWRCGRTFVAARQMWVHRCPRQSLTCMHTSWQ